MTAPAFYEAQGGGLFRCQLCFRRCLLKPGDWGFCRARAVDASGRFISPYLGRFCSLAVDPIEKKPLRRWRPGTQILSLGSLGCTMSCPYCQNHQISRPTEPMELLELSPARLVERCRALGLEAVAYTYNEPTVQAEYILEAAPLLNHSRLATVLVTNGVFSPEFRRLLSPWLAAANVDLKSFKDEVYAQLGGSLAVVKDNISELAAAGVHVELSALVVPGLSDSPEDMASLSRWAAALSPDMPLHLARYFPRYRYQEPPTELELLKRLAEIARENLNYVYLGNI